MYMEVNFLPDKWRHTGLFLLIVFFLILDASDANDAMNSEFATCEIGFVFTCLLSEFDQRASPACRTYLHDTKRVMLESREQPSIGSGASGTAHSNCGGCVNSREILMSVKALIHQKRASLIFWREILLLLTAWAERVYLICT